MHLLQALKCIWQLVEGNHACQQHLLEAAVPNPQGLPAPALQVRFHHLALLCCTVTRTSV